jgi:hypothetical protein
MKRTTIIAASFLTALLLVSCGDTMAFRTATDADTISAFREYLSSTRMARTTDAAYRRVEDLYYEASRRMTQSAAYDRYLREYPRGRHAKEAARAQKKCAYEAAVKARHDRGAEAVPFRETPRARLADDARPASTSSPSRPPRPRTGDLVPRVPAGLPRRQARGDARAAIERLAYLEAARADRAEGLRALP